jgi:hypothetical protein
MSKDFQALDTTVVQVRSVLNFMYALGYTLDEESKSGRFVSKNKMFKGNKHLSFSTAAKLHNLADENWSVDQTTGVAKPSCVNLVNGFTVIGVRLAQASKLVKQVKLSLSKHGDVITLDVMVVPLNKVVEGLIGL